MARTRSGPRCVSAQLSRTRTKTKTQALDQISWVLVQEVTVFKAIFKVICAVILTTMQWTLQTLAESGAVRIYESSGHSRYLRFHDKLSLHRSFATIDWLKDHGPGQLVICAVIGPWIGLIHSFCGCKWWLQITQTKQAESCNWLCVIATKTVQQEWGPTYCEHGRNCLFTLVSSRVGRRLSQYEHTLISGLLLALPPVWFCCKCEQALRQVTNGLIEVIYALILPSRTSYTVLTQVKYAYMG